MNDAELARATEATDSFAKTDTKNYPNKKEA